MCAPGHLTSNKLLLESDLAEGISESRQSLLSGGFFLFFRSSTFVHLRHQLNPNSRRTMPKKKAGRQVFGRRALASHEAASEAYTVGANCVVQASVSANWHQL